jgi:hypothetical protein
MDFRKLVDVFGSELPKIRAESDQWQELTREATAQLNRHMTIDAPAIMRESMTAFANGNMDVIENIEARLRAMCRESYEELTTARDQLSSSKYRQGNESAVLRALRRVQSQTFSLPPRIRAIEPDTLVLKNATWDGGQTLWSDNNPASILDKSHLLANGWGLQNDTDGSTSVRVACALRDRNGFMTPVHIYNDRDIAVNSDKKILVDLKPVLEKARRWHDRLVVTFTGERLRAVRSLPIVWEEAPDPPNALPIPVVAQPLRVLGIRILVNTLVGDKEPEGEVAFVLRHQRFPSDLVNIVCGRNEHWGDNTYRYIAPNLPSSPNHGTVMEPSADTEWFTVGTTNSEYVNSGERVDLIVNLRGDRTVFFTPQGVWWWARFKLRFKLSDGRIGETDWSDSCDIDSRHLTRHSFKLSFDVGPK